jgi:DNA-binding CsgD family transcriptional regulator
VAELPPGGLDVAIEVGRIAAGPGTIEQRAEAVLGQLRRLVPFQAGALYLLSAERRELLSLVSHGYDAVPEYLNSPVVMDDIELLGLDRSRTPLRMQDMPVPWQQVRGWAEYLRPAGFREGLGVGLFTPDGRHLGLLGLNTDSAEHPTEAARDLIGSLATVIAHAVDPMRSVAALARVVHDAQAGIALGPTGHPVALPGLSSHPLLVVGSAVLVVARRFLDERVYAGFLCPVGGAEAADAYARITAIACPPEPPLNLVGMVLVSPAGDLVGLTRRELQILGMLVEGWSNARMAAAMVVAQRTVAAHIEHILAKLRVSTRTLAAVRAYRLGVFVPRPLSGIQG